MSSNSTSVHTQDFPVTEDPSSSSRDDVPLAWTMPQPFKHRGWARDRARVYAAIQASASPAARARRFASCGAQHWVLMHRDQSSLYRIVASTCKDRFCVPCGRSRAWTLRNNLANKADGLTLRMLTLTLQHTDRPLADQLDHLHTAFRTLRRSRLWRDRVRGGLAFVEIALSATDGCWHPHYHILLDSDYLPQAQLAALWLDATGTSRVIDIRLVRDRRIIDGYVTKYVTKPIPAAVYRQPDRLQAAVDALAHRRLYWAIGSWSRWGLLSHADPSKWTLYAHEDAIWERAMAGDMHASAILDQLHAYVYGDADPEFVLVPELYGRSPPPAATPDAQLRLW